MNETKNFVLSNGNAISFADYGDPSGQPIFYFHGWPSSRFQARLIHDVALEKKLRIVAADRPGIGGSTFIKNRQLLDWPPVINELADHLHFDEFSVLGISGGGPYAIACAYHLTDRIRHAGVVCGAPPLAELEDRSQMIWPYRALMRMRKIWPPLLSPVFWVAKPMSRLNPDGLIMRQMLKAAAAEDRAAMTASHEKYRWIMRSFEESVAQGSRGVIADSDVFFQPWNINYDEIKTPIRFWHGERDNNIPISMARHLIAKIPIAEPEFFPEEAHFSLPLRNAASILETFCQGSIPPRLSNRI